MGLIIDQYKHPTGSAGLYNNAFIALSLRDLGLGFTGDIVTVERSSDNAQSGFTFTELSDGTLTAWVGGGNNGVVMEWQNQGYWSGSVSQSTAANAPIIVNSGILVTTNGLVSMDCLSGDSLSGDWSATETFPSDFMSFIVSTWGNGGTTNNPDNVNYIHFNRSFGNATFRHNGTTATFTSVGISSNNQVLLECLRDSAAGDIQFLHDGIDEGTQSMDNDWLNAKLELSINNQEYQEVIYIDNITDNASDIRSDINLHYSVY